MRLSKNIIVSHGGRDNHPSSTHLAGKDVPENLEELVPAAKEKAMPVYWSSVWREPSPEEVDVAATITVGGTADFVSVWPEPMSADGTILVRSTVDAPSDVPAALPFPVPTTYSELSRMSRENLYKLAAHLGFQISGSGSNSKTLRKMIESKLSLS